MLGNYKPDICEVCPTGVQSSVAMKTDAEMSCLRNRGLQMFNMLSVEALMLAAPNITDL